MVQVTRICFAETNMPTVKDRERNKYEAEFNPLTAKGRGSTNRTWQSACMEGEVLIVDFCNSAADCANEPLQNAREQN